MEKNEVLEYIENANDTELMVLSEYLREIRNHRQQLAARRMVAQLEIGSRVKVKGNVKPKYMAGLTGTVEEFKNSRVLVKLDCGPINKFRTGKVLMPLTTIEEI